MLILGLPMSSPCWFSVIAILWSLFQSYAGYQYGIYIFTTARNDNSPWHVRVLAYGLHHALWYFVCSFSGFVAWYLAEMVAMRVCNWSEVANGTGVVFVALAAIALMGVSGALSRLLYLGKKPT